MEAHVSAVCRSARFHLRNIGKIRRFLTADACEKVVHALVTCRLDLNNALLSGLPQCLLARVQRCQNVAARIVTCRKQTCHITPVRVPRELHWLPVTHRVQFKILLHVYRALNDIAPAYITDIVHLYQPSRTRGPRTTFSFKCQGQSTPGVTAPLARQVHHYGTSFLSL